MAVWEFAYVTRFYPAVWPSQLLEFIYVFVTPSGCIAKESSRFISSIIRKNCAAEQSGRQELSWHWWSGQNKPPTTAAGEEVRDRNPGNARFGAVALAGFVCGRFCTVWGKKGRRNKTKREKTTFPNVESRFGNRADVTHATLAWKVYPPSQDDVLLFLRTPSVCKFIFFVNFLLGRKFLEIGFSSVFLLCCTHICIVNRISAYNSVYTVRSTISLHIVLLFCLD